MSSSKTHFIANQWQAGEGAKLISTDPATGNENWHGQEASESQAAAAVSAAAEASGKWAALSFDDRCAKLQKLAEIYRVARPRLAEVISRETGKPLWESNTEVDAMIGKVAISIESARTRTASSEREIAGAMAGIRYQPLGVLAVIGPFNMPGHLPNGHIVPALLAGNAVVFKPSEQTPLVGEAMAECFETAGFPPGVFNLIQGGPLPAMALAKHPQTAGVLFTGSTVGGTAFSRALADEPWKMLALEMGGNNPLIVHDVADHAAAVFLTIQSAFITAGQRCTCARRLIVPQGEGGDAFLQKLVDASAKIRVGFYNDDPPPFLGPVIHRHAAERILAAQQMWMAAGAEPLLEMGRSPRCEALLTPGIIDVTTLASRSDEEVFGPLLQVIRVRDFDAAVAEANHTRYGLSAGLISNRQELFGQFLRRVHAGVLHFNKPLTGASSQLPFGGVGRSGNHRPSGAFAADYCAAPVATLTAQTPQLPAQLPPGVCL